MMMMGFISSTPAGEEEDAHVLSLSGVIFVVIINGPVFSGGLPGY
jgi:hypothetical protein